MIVLSLNSVQWQDMLFLQLEYLHLRISDVLFKFQYILQLLCHYYFVILIIITARKYLLLINDPP